jgi:hypothetical protein
MEAAISTEVRNTLDKFAPKLEVPRNIRLINLTDDVWQWLTAVANKAGMSRNDYLEALAVEDNNCNQSIKLYIMILGLIIKQNTETHIQKIKQAHFSQP